MIKRTYDELEEELNAIRLSLYEEVKGMTPDEELSYLHAKTEPIIQKYGLERSTLQPVRPVKRERIPF